MTRRICAYRVDGENSDRVPSGGSSTSATPTCIGVVGVSSERNAASIPSSACITVPSYPLSPLRSRARVPEPAAAPHRLSQPVPSHGHELRLLHPDDDELGDAVTPLDRVVVVGVVVDQQDLELTVVPRVDEARRVEAGDAVPQGEAAARKHQAGVARWDGHRHPRGDEGTSPAAAQRDRGPCRQVRAGVAGPGVRRDHRVDVDAVERDGASRDATRRPVACPAVLAWIDLEMTGLNPDLHTIVEIACLVTDDELALIEEGPDLVVHATAEQLADMDDFVRTMHTRSGLLDAVEASTTTIADASAQTLEFLKKHISVPSTVPLAGNSIGTDRRFLARQMPEVEDFLHYRSVDVSTVKELCRRWCPQVYKAAPVKKGGHRALQDIRESVRELAYYRGALFGPEGAGRAGPDCAGGEAEEGGTREKGEEAT